MIAGGQRYSTIKQGSKKKQDELGEDIPGKPTSKSIKLSKCGTHKKKRKGAQPATMKFGAIADGHEVYSKLCTVAKGCGTVECTFGTSRCTFRFNDEKSALKFAGKVEDIYSGTFDYSKHVDWDEEIDYSKKKMKKRKKYCWVTHHPEGQQNNHY